MQNEDMLKLCNQLCFPLYACAKEVVKKYRPYLDDIDLTYTQYITMMVMWEHKKVNVRKLGECLHLDSGTLTPVLKKLESKGLVKRERSIEDERNVIVSITKDGEELKLRAIGIPRKMGECLSLTKEEMETLCGLLNKILE